MQTLSDLKKRVKELIAKDEFPKVFKLLKDAVTEDSSRSNTIINLQGQYQRNQNQHNLGIESTEVTNQIFNRIRLALLAVVEDLEEEDLNAGFLQSNSSHANLTSLERQGLENQLHILQKKLNFLLEQHAILNDPAQKFTVQMQIDETQKQINEIKSKLGTS